jgi:hypothetical protein
MDFADLQEAEGQPRYLRHLIEAAVASLIEQAATAIRG